MEMLSLYNLGVYIVCFSGLLYQTIMLLLDFLSGQTVVAIKLGRAQFEHLPAITLCSINHQMYKRLAQIDPELYYAYGNYTRILDEFEKVTFEHPESIDDRVQNIRKTNILKFSKEIHRKINFKEMNAKDILENTPLTG